MRKRFELLLEELSIELTEKKYEQFIIYYDIDLI